VRVGAWRTEDAAAAAAQDGAVAAQEGAAAKLEDAAEVAARRGCEAAQGGRRAGKEKKKNRIIAALYRLEHQLIRCGKKGTSVQI
jgi:hypothetical protein